MEFTELKLEKEMTTAQKNKLLKKNINNVNDLLRIEPKKYCDCRRPASLSNALPGNTYAFRVRVDKVTANMGKQANYVKVICYEGNIRLNIIYFDPYIYDKIAEYEKQEIIVYGEYTENEYGRQITNPDILELYSEKACRVYPTYPKTPGMSIQYFNTLIRHALKEYNEADYMDQQLLEQFHIVTERQMIQGLHMPQNPQDVIEARKRLVLETIYPLAEYMVETSMKGQKSSKYKIVKQESYDRLLSMLPFRLTKDQAGIMEQFINKSRAGKRIHSMIQGDVGSGKTIVAFLSMILMAENGYQSVLMAPTGILARQHYAQLQEYASQLGLHAAYLGSDTKASEKKKICAGLQSGEIQLLVGTHSVITDDIVFADLGLTIVDEEHKFGVLQREALKKKAAEGVHHISMSATPIPRSLAQSIYGNVIEINTIESMPEGRMPVKTAMVQKYKPMFAFMAKEIQAGHQCYMVCPMIEDRSNDEVDLEEKQRPLSVEEVLKMAQQYFTGTTVEAAAITGKMKDKEKDEIINAFTKNEVQILIATTIIEVGVNVPNATVISIMNAERFGLAGLHQLRGRVGRSNLQSYCMLVSSDTQNPRLQAMCKTNNGFEIAEEDLKLRGSGDLLGLKQSGEDARVTLMLKYPQLFHSLTEYIRHKLEEYSKQ